jgi:bisphosphoglycerate-dependent phosphoglycerate mutase
MSQMILAEQYKLLVPVSAKKGIYKQDGPKELVASKKLVKRHYAEQQNKQPNNTFYIFFEEETKELMKEREVSIAKQAEDKKKESVTMADLVTTVAKAVAPNDEFEGKTLEDLRAMCDERDIEYYKTAGVSKLKELLKS